MNIAIFSWEISIFLNMATSKNFDDEHIFSEIKWLLILRVSFTLDVD